MNQPGKIVVICTAVDSEDTAQALAKELVERRLAACVQCMPVRSTYRWRGVVENAGEFLLSAKTARDRTDEVVRFLRERHTYELPEIIVLPVDGGSRPYLDWVLSETAP